LSATVTEKLSYSDAIRDGRNFSRKSFPFQLRITTATEGNDAKRFLLFSTNIKDFSFSFFNIQD
jgi:hypothetical protein